MNRSRPELPSEPEPVGRDEETLQSKKRRKRKEAAEEKAEQAAAEEQEVAPDETSDESADTETETADLESIKRELAAEQAFRERVALAEVLNRLTPESRITVEQALAKQGGEWRLEKGRYIFQQLVEERTVPTESGPVEVEQKLALDRDEPPVPPRQVDTLITEVLATDAPVEEAVRKLEPLREALPEGDEIRITQTADRPEIVVTSDEIRVESDETEKTVEPTEPEAIEPIEVPERSTVESLIAEVEQEAEPQTDPDTVEVSIEPEAGFPKEEPVPAETDPTRNELTEVLAILDREAVDLNDLPPIQGGAPEADGLSAEEIAEVEESLPTPELPEEQLPEIEPEIVQTEEALFPPRPAETDEPRPRKPRSRKGREILKWNPEMGNVEEYPDHQMRRKARKLVRRLAAEYGIKLTPQTEAYLLAIVLQPHRINGRLVYSLGLNIEKLIAVLGVLKYNFNQTRRPPAAG